MRWNSGGRSADLEDRRGGGGFGIGGGGLGIGGFLILLVLSFVFKQNFFSLIGGGTGASPSAAVRPVNDPAEEPEVRFVSFVLDDAQNTWTQILQQNGAEYKHAKLVLFRDVTRSGCGKAQSQTGPFYCPADERVYIDLGFFDELKRKYGAPGDFAQAYVIAHELGHHVQNLMGIEQKVRRAMQANPSQQNALSVRLELQADCFAGIWGYSTQQRNILEPNEVEEGLKAAAAVGDDRLSRSAGRQVSPESFTHGSSEQRMQWFRQGFDSGDFKSCNTFAQ